jgi:hypothetical protein
VVQCPLFSKIWPIERELLSAEIIGPHNSGSAVGLCASQSNIRVSIISVEKTELRSTKIRVFYDGFELVLPFDQEIFPEAIHDDEATTLHDGTSAFPPGNSFAYGAELFAPDRLYSVQVLDLTGNFKRKGGEERRAAGQVNSQLWEELLLSMMKFSWLIVFVK